MKKIANFYSALIEHFRSENGLKSNLSEVYDQFPQNPAVPYMFISLDLIEDIFTYDAQIHRAELSYHIFCENLMAMIKTIESLQASSNAFLGTRDNVTVANVVSKITCTPSYGYNSVICIEVLFRDFG